MDGRPFDPKHYEDLGPDEDVLIGSWMVVRGQVDGDWACKRINWLIAERLEKVGADASGWDTLWCDSRDGRLWELTYPESYQHGGGPPKLEWISREAAHSKYEY